MIKKAIHHTRSDQKQTNRISIAAIAALLIMSFVLSSGCITKGDTSPGGTKVTVVSFAVDNSSISASDPEAERLFIDGLTYNAQNGRFEEAIACFDEAIAIDPDFAEAWFGKGISNYNLQRYDEALTSFDEAIAINPDFKDAWYFKGTTLTDMGRDDEAAYYFEQAERCNTEHSLPEK
ncbi:tetratricopeptide repeat protein [Methanogenium marinum]|uniref:Tetratricopeptide repeat protein n=1 Tax=Methanogenium marinum TaxID=348610 RepID=A0A9Q4KN87_9EURY|nr:tetratricopeptide repeat protein [Methanogenium marinum]MDE4907533.1 tetratricopeptide repeat protein [Methanogenium marinum]